MSFNLATILTETASAAPDAPVCRIGGTPMTYRELDEQSAHFAAGLRSAGLAPGDVVALQLPNLPQFLIAYFGTVRAGLVLLPLNPLLMAPELEYHLSDSSARVLIGFAGMLTHFQLYMNATIAGGLFGARPDDVVLAVLPFFHVFGLSSVINVSVRYGACLSIVPRFQPDAVLDVLERERCSVIAGVPTMLHALARHGIAGRDLSALRVAVSGGASLPEDVMRTFEAMYRIPVLEGYGLSETASSCSFNRPDDRRLLSIGKPDERLGEEVVAVVVLRSGCEVSAAEIIGYCRERLAAYKYPREIRFMDDLPKGPSGKILKAALR